MITRENEKWFRIAGLLARQRVGQLSEEELRELEEWREVSPENKLLYDRWQDGAFLEVGFKNYQRIGRRKALLDMEKRVQLQRKKEVRLRVLRWGAVAAVFVVAVFSSLYLFERETEEPVKEQVAIALMKPQRPVLRLDDGTTMLLDSLKGDFEEAGILVKKTGESTLSYSAENLPQQAQLAYNTIEVPKGAEFDLILSDGTRVWLNADSKLKYPVTFGNDKREVELEGEGYFKVTKDERKPFRVVVKKQTVEVLGTEFNVDAYPGEKNTYTTLVSGKVKVDADGQTVILDPGMQSVVNDEKMYTRKVNVAEVISWRNGMFVLENHTLEEIMSKLARWYDFTVFNHNTSLKEATFKGKIPRYASFESVLDILEKTGEVKFNVKNQTVTVYQ